MVEILKRITYAFLTLGAIMGTIIVTVYAASKGDTYWFLILLGAYTGSFLIVEKMMKSFVGPTKPTILSHNKKVESRIIEIGNMFRRAQEYIAIVSQCLRHEVFASEEVVTALKGAIEDRNVTVEIIIEDEVDPVVFPLIAEWVKNGNIRLYKLPGYQVSRHFIVVDGIEVRIEKKHGPDYQERKASYWFFYRRLGYHIKNKFESIKEKATLVQLNVLQNG